MAAFHFKLYKQLSESQVKISLALELPVTEKMKRFFKTLNINHPAVFVMLRFILNQHFDVREHRAQAAGYARRFVRDNAKACHRTHLLLRSRSVLQTAFAGNSLF